MAKEEPLHDALPKIGQGKVIAQKRLPAMLAPCTWRKTVTFVFGLLLAMVATPALFAQNDPTSSPSIGDRISSGFGSIGRALTPSPAKPVEDDPVALKTPAKPGVELFVAVARVYEEAGKFKEADEQYRAALKVAPYDLRVLLGVAKLKDREDEADESERYYKQAAAKFPEVPAVFNNMAGHYAHRGMLREAMVSMEKAIKLSPKEPRYRTNLAALLVAAGRNDEAFGQLRAVYDEPVAHYDLGFLLNRQNKKQEAAQQFAIALQLNPGLVYARQYLDRLAVEGVAMNRPSAPRSVQQQQQQLAQQQAILQQQQAMQTQAYRQQQPTQQQQMVQQPTTAPQSTAGQWPQQQAVQYSQPMATQSPVMIGQPPMIQQPPLQDAAAMQPVMAQPAIQQPALQQQAATAQQQAAMQQSQPVPQSQYVPQAQYVPQPQQAAVPQWSYTVRGASSNGFSNEPVPRWNPGPLGATSSMVVGQPLPTGQQMSAVPVPTPQPNAVPTTRVELMTDAPIIQNPLQDGTQGGVNVLRLPQGDAPHTAERPEYYGNGNRY